MKLKSLFLASLAAMAMVSCSNDVEGVDNNGVNAEKDAKLQFSIGFPGVTTTRAETKPEEGTFEESGIKTVNVRVDYTEAISDDVFNFKFPEDFVKDENSYTYTLKSDKVMKVAPTTAAILYVTVNGDEKVTLDGTVNAEYDATASIRTGVAEDGNFLMSGKSETAIKIEKNSVDNKATVNVDRVVARIDETTKNKVTEFTFETEYRNTEGATTNTETISMTAEIIDYALFNLNKNSNIFKLDKFATPDYFQKFKVNKLNEISYSNLVNKAIGSTNTYTLENNSSEYVTSVIYQVKYKYDNNTATGDFFVYVKEGKAVLYKDFASLDKDNDKRFSLSFGLSENSTYDDFIAAGVTRYVGGVAYYIQPITTGAVSSIARNNCYKLNVTKISALGKAVVDPKDEGKPSVLSLSVVVKPWTVNENNFEL